MSHLKVFLLLVAIFSFSKHFTESSQFELHNFDLAIIKNRDAVKEKSPDFRQNIEDRDEGGENYFTPASWFTQCLDHFNSSININTNSQSFKNNSQCKDIWKQVVC